MRLGNQPAEVHAQPDTARGPRPRAVGAVEGLGEPLDLRFVDADAQIETAAGTYIYLCTEPGHYAAGMKGTLTVE